MKKEDKNIILNYFNKLFPSSKCELNYNNPFQLLIAVILSAQCTDKRVNMVTPILFKKFETPKDFANADTHEIEQIIKPCGLYHNKAKNIISASKDICNRFNDIVPNTVSELMTLSGVGMKTAKVVCGEVFNAKVIAVDTHVLRVSNRLGIVNEKNPDKCSLLLEKIFKDDIVGLHHRMVMFGRYHCKAINPDCNNCELKMICKYFNKKNKSLKISKNKV